MDIFQKYSGYPIAAFSVKGFFLVSGILVTNSLFRHENLVNYSISRFLRIFPALSGVVLFTAVILGPITSTLDLQKYFKSEGVYQYIFAQLTFRTWGSTNSSFFNLPGVFENNTYPGAVNASLWSLTPEIYAYILLALAYYIFLKNKTAITFAAGVVILDSMSQDRIIFTSLPKGVLDFSDLPFFFATGVLIAVYKDKIFLNTKYLLCLAVLSILLRNDLIGTQIKILFVLLLLLTIFLQKWPRFLTPKVDLSYGVFLYGFPVSQLITYKFPNLNNFILYFMFVTIVTLTMAYFSAKWIEKPFMQQSRIFEDKVNQFTKYFKNLRGKS
jgi:peptidoglycan/LPS O-acetylase OafA/YrhL